MCLSGECDTIPFLSASSWHILPKLSKHSGGCSEKACEQKQQLTGGDPDAQNTVQIPLNCCYGVGFGDQIGILRHPE